MADLSVMSFLNEETQQETEYNLKDAQARNDISTINGKIPSGASSSNKMATASDITAINNKIPSAASSTNKLVDTTAMNDAIGQAVSAAYKPAGNKTVAELTSSLLVAANRGKVYNMTDAGTTTADFVEGAGNPIRVGDDVGICEPTTGTFKFNLLSGFVAVDTNPTQGSANPVSSGGVYTALDGKISKSSSAGYVKNDGSIDTGLATTVANKVDKVAGKGLSTNDYDNTAKGIVDNIQSNVIASTKLIKDTVGWCGKNKCETIPSFTLVKGSERTKNNTIKDTPNYGTYKVSFTISNAANITKQGGIQIGDSAGNWSASVDGVFDVVNGRVLLTIPFAHAVSRIYVFLNGNDGNTATATFSDFMIMDADILDDTYEPYHESVKDTLREAEVIEGKNLLENQASSSTNNGVQFTVNADGTITATRNTTSSSNAVIRLNSTLINVLKRDVNYIASGGVDSGIYYYIVGNKNGSLVKTYASATGSDVLFSIPSTDDIDEIIVNLRVNSAKSPSNAVYKPMIRLATETDSTYEPYYIPLKDSMFRREEQRILGAKNILDNRASTTENNGVTFTVNRDGSITANGTATALARVALWNNIGSFLKVGERYTISTGLPSNSPTDYFLNFVQKHDNTDLSNIAIFGEETTVTIDSQCNNLYIAVIVSNGKTANNVTFKPMVRLASDPDDTYAPFVMTNEELTDKVTLKNGLSSVTVIEGATLSANDSFLRKQNNVISAQLRVNGVTANSGANIATIPSGFIPSLTGGTVVFMSNASTGEMIPAYITINGYVRARTNLSSVDVNINFTYIAP